MNKKEKSDYRKLAKSKNMEWIGKDLPKSTTVSTLWKCNLCTLETKKSYHKMLTGNNPCRCRSNSINTPDDYRQLALELSQKYNADFYYPNQDYPANTYQKVYWQVNGTQIQETYHNLAYYERLPEHVEMLIKRSKND